jgi:phosphopantothenoylcysteine decarboxylase/phosphopantothenate--cysteine ligase
MKTAVLMASAEADVLLMAAAVADYRPAEPSLAKLKRSKGIPQVKLEATEDILAAVMADHAQSGQQTRVVGFAAESDDLLENARAKLGAKGVDLIVANDISRERRRRAAAHVEGHGRRACPGSGDVLVRAGMRQRHLSGGTRNAAG